MRGFAASEGNSMVRHIAERGSQPFFKWSLQDLLALEEKTEEERLRQLDQLLHVGISKVILLLQDLPLGFAASGPIRSVIEDYVQDLRDLRECPPDHADNYRQCILTIFNRHRGMLGQIARGLVEFQTELTEGFQPVADFVDTNCADVVESVAAVKRIEGALDEFFTIRTTLRLLIAHCVQLHPNDKKSEAFSMHELLARVPSQSKEARETEAFQTRYVGAICLDTRPSLVLVEAYRHAQYMCLRTFGRAPQLMINNVPAQEYLTGNQDLPMIDTSFPYVDIHLYFVFFEVLKNALVSSIIKAGPDAEPEPVHASLITGTSLLTENERSVKITDSGEGIGREDVRKVWSYFHSTLSEGGFLPGAASGARPCLGGLDSDIQSTSMDPPEMPLVNSNAQPLTGRGLGLTVSRVLVRYFGGEIDLHSIPRKGTDVYIYL